MNSDFQNVILEGLTQALEKNVAVTIKSNTTQGIIVITATNEEIIASISKMQYLMQDVITIISNALDARPDMVYDRNSLISGEFRVYYAVWFRKDGDAREFIKKEYSFPDNNITFLSEKALSVIQSIS
jgi:hypothetical protein